MDIFRNAVVTAIHNARSHGLSPSKASFDLISSNLHLESTLYQCNGVKQSPNQNSSLGISSIRRRYQELKGEAKQTLTRKNLQDRASIKKFRELTDRSPSDATLMVVMTRKKPGSSDGVCTLFELQCPVVVS
ncbi:unnamed protein product [Vicia faba]|uniref:Uncharacterized protein n=1 Tax=Vicia faba TaxID=3906 RepID=A0AAV0ZEA8_VICFA|nr:unnamed protein product [Vicia faba]